MDHFCYLCLEFFMHLRLFVAALCSPAGKGLTSWVFFVMFNCFVDFPCGILGQVCYLIVSIPDLCCISYFTLVFIPQVRLYIGIYFIYLQDWLKVFPLEHIFILRLEDYAERREENVLKLYKFLSLSKYIRIYNEYKGGIEISVLKIRACLLASFDNP